MQEGDESALRSSLMNIQMSHNHEGSSSGAIQTDPPERSESFGFRTGHESFPHVCPGRDWTSGSYTSCMTGVTQELLDIRSSWFLWCQSLAMLLSLLGQASWMQKWEFEVHKFSGSQNSWYFSRKENHWVVPAYFPQEPKLVPQNVEKYHRMLVFLNLEFHFWHNVRQITSL